MGRDGVLIFVVVLFFVGLVGANVADVTLVGEIGDFSGAIMKIESPVSGAMSEKILPYQYNLISVGILKFKAETSLSEVYLNFIVTKDGSVVNEIRKGPFEINGSDVLVDLREKVELEVLKEVEVDENLTEEVVSNVTENVTVNVSEENVSLVSEEVGGSSFANLWENFVITGKAIFLDEDGSVKFGASFVSVAVLLFFGLFVFMMFKKGRRDLPHIGQGVVGEDKELEELEEKVKATEGRISKIKKKEEVERKKAELKERLAREEAELKGLEKKEPVEEIEDAE